MEGADCPGGHAVRGNGAVAEFAAAREGYLQRAQGGGRGGATLGVSAHEHGHVPGADGRSRWNEQRGREDLVVGEVLA